MKNKGIMILAITAIIVLVLAIVVWNQDVTTQNNMHKNTESTPSAVVHNASAGNTNKESANSGNEKDNPNSLIMPREGQPVKKYELIASESGLIIRDGLTIPVWAYNGTVPGQEIRVMQGDFVQVKLTNKLQDPVTIHWHGYPLLSAMDGVPGINQDAVKSGESFEYLFSADVAGTYWYHSHQEGAKQVDKGLYGALIVEPKEGLSVDKEFTLILDEWMEAPVDSMEQMEGMDMGSANQMNQGDLVMAEEEMMADSYNIYTVNGKSGDLIAPLEVYRGDKVRLRFINAGYRSHGIHIPEQEFKIVSIDGQDITGAQVIKDQIIMIAPGERYDVEFIVTGEDSFVIDAHDGNKYNEQLKIPVNVKDGDGYLRMETTGDDLPLFDLTAYGVPDEGTVDINENDMKEYLVELNAGEKDGILQYTINGQVFSELPSLKVKTGDVIKLTYMNNSEVDHPMHLHGHFFKVLSKNDKFATGAIITKDTLLIKPGEKYTVVFNADNPGLWVQHCHELHHAAAGMMQIVEYIDSNQAYKSDPDNIFNKPE